MGKFDDAFRTMQSEFSKLADSSAEVLDAVFKLARDQSAAASEISTQATVSTLLLAGAGAKLAADAFSGVSDRAAATSSDAMASVANAGKALGRTAAGAADATIVGISVTGRHAGAVVQRAARDEAVRSTTKKIIASSGMAIPHPVLRVVAPLLLGVVADYVLDIVAGDDTAT